MGLAERHLPHYTVKDYMRWEGDWELIEGIPFAMAPSPLGIHQAVAMEIGRQIANQLEDCKHPCFVYPELDWVISEDTVVRPDLIVICKKIKEFVRETPEVVIEVVSSSTARKDEHLKFELYQRERVPTYIMVYPEFKKVRVFALKDNSFTKIFDSDEGKLEVELKNGCGFLIDINKLWSAM